MEDKILVSSFSAHVRQLVINRPQQRNALDRQTYQLLTQELTAADANDDIRVIVLSGQGGCFTAGNDLKDFTEKKFLDQEERSFGLQLLLTLHAMKKPVIAAVEGYAVGIGTTMLNHCDLAYCGNSARFRLPFSLLGLSPEGGSTFYLPLAAGYKKAAELLWFGDFFTAEDAHQFRLINEIVDDNTATQHALEKAERLAGLPFQSVLTTKKMLKSRNFALIETILEDEAKIFHKLRVSDEAQTIIANFFRK
ncbi:enoyl-CoA hydratase-related protein [uncultured Bartonella sp.]|uniref:enoyl-CoA hydratase/isomerase family protein n=1 Tax=uncultured Bartonella sp. TaxID=104108 RepID=UPI0026288FDB|nr:enoyl-CoA hydratase-related protein [uncultured Bartonella sp.]